MPVGAPLTNQVMLPSGTSPAKVLDFRQEVDLCAVTHLDADPGREG